MIPLKSLEKIWILILFSYLISFGFTCCLSTDRDFLTDGLQSAALQVISMHSSAKEDLFNGETEVIDGNGTRSRRSVHSFAFTNIPVLENSSNIVVPDPELMSGQKITELMYNLKERFVFQQTYLQKLSDALKHAIRPNSNGMVLTTSLIRNLTIFNGVTVTQIKSLTKLFWQNSRISLNDLKFKPKDLLNVINGVKQQIAAIIQTTNDLVLRNRPAMITGHKRFVGHNRIGSLNSTVALIGSVGRQDLRQMMTDLYRRRRPQTVRGVKHILNNVFVNHAITSGLVNGIELHKQIVTTNTPQMIKSRVHYESQLSVVNHMGIRGRINEFDISRDLVFLNVPQVVIAPKIFVSPSIMAQTINCQTIDGIDLRQLSQNVLKSNGVQTVKSKLILTKPVTTKSIAVAGMFNDIDISMMSTQLVYKNRPVLVKGKKNFILDDLHIKNHLSVKQQIDGQYIPQTLLLRNMDQVISGHKIFKGITRFEANVSVKGFVDGLRLPNDIVTLTRNEVIGGLIIFDKGLVANKHIDARRRVDGVDLSELQLYSLKLNDKVISSDVHFNKPVSIGAIEVLGSVNDVNLTDLFANAIFKGSPNVVITGHKFFEFLEAKQLLSQYVNKFSLNDFMTTFKDEDILFTKVFNAVNEFNSIRVKGFVAGLNVTNLYENRISLSRPDVITGVKNFVDPLLVTNGLSVDAINGFVPQIDFFLKSVPQIIKGPKIFTKSLISNKVLTNPKNPTVVRGQIDGLFLKSFASKAIRLNDNRFYPLNIFLSQSNSSYVEVFRDMNGLNITQFANNVMSLTKPQIVFAQKVFRSEQTFSVIHSFKGISGISLSDLKSKAIRLDSNSHIDAPFAFTHIIEFERPLVVQAMVNGVNLSYLATDAVFKTGNKLIFGQNVFRSGFEVNGNIHSFSFNGIDLSNQLLTNTRDHIIRAKVKFIKTLHINGDIVLNGLINGLDLSDWNKRVMRTNDRNVITGNFEMFGVTQVLTNLNVAGPLNRINLTHMFNEAIFLDGNQVISGQKTISGPIQLLRHLNTTNLNGFNVPELLKDMVFLNSPYEQHIFSPKVFVNDIISHGLIQSKGISQMGSINGINLMLLNSDSVKTNIASNLKLNRNFKDFVIITNNLTEIMGRINGINLMRDVIHLRPYGKIPQVITGTKVFTHLRLNDNALIDGLVNGFSLKDIEKNTLFMTNDQRIIGHKIVKGLLELSADNNFVTTLNGLRIPEDLVTLNTNQTIFGHLVFKNPIIVNRNLFVSGLVMGHNLTKLATESLLKDRPQVLGQPIRFETLVFRQDVMVDQHVNNIDLSGLSNTVKQFTHSANITKDMLISKANRHHYISDYLYHTLEKSVFEIDSFTLYQSLDEIHGNHIDVLADGVFTLSESIETPKTVQSIRFNPKTELFDVSHIKTNPFVVRNPFVLMGEEFGVYLSPFSHNLSAQITKDGQSVATIGPLISSVEVLKISDNRVILVSFQSNTGKLLVHLFEIRPKKQFIFTEITETNVGIDTSKVIAFLNSDQIYIVVAKRVGLNCVLESSASLIFILRNQRTLELIQEVPVINVMDVIHFENNRKHYLALSDGTPVETSLNPQTIYIYRSDLLMSGRCRFSLFQKLFFDNTIQLSTFTYGTIYSQNQYLLAANASDVSIWKQKGESGFTENWVLETKSARVISPLISANNLYLVVGQRYKCHESLIFRAETRGIALAPIIFRTK